MRRNFKPVAFVLFLAILLTPCLCFAGEYYPNPLLDDMIRLDKWNNSEYIVEQHGNTYQVREKINQIDYADDLSKTFSKVDDEYSGYWPDGPRFTHYSKHAIAGVHPSSPTAVLPIRATTSAIHKITTSTSIIGNVPSHYDFPTKSSLIIITPEAVTTPAIEPEYDTPTGITAMFLGANGGDATLFEVGGAYALIDTSGELDKADLIESLQYLGVEKLEYLILTNTKLDRVGGAMDILETFQVDNVIMPSGVNDNSTFDKVVMNTMMRPNVYYPDAGDLFDLNGADIRFLGPVKTAYVNTDNLSLVTKVSFGDMDYLLMSDSRVESENDIYLAYGGTGVLDNIEVLSLSDAGSASGTTIEFATYINPSTVVISAAEKDILVGNPTIERLTELQLITPDIYVTSISGSIEIISDGTMDYNVFTTY